MKRKVILYISQSLDGFIADKNGGVDWISGNDKNYESDYGYDDFISNVDTVILGYNTYRQIITELSPDSWIYDNLQTCVLTSKQIDDTENIKFINSTITDLLNNLKQKSGKNIWICGGADIVNQCVKDDLIDEYQITTVPVILGDGIRLFSENGRNIELKLKDVKTENGLITAVYEK